MPRTIALLTACQGATEAAPVGVPTPTSGLIGRLSLSQDANIWLGAEIFGVGALLVLLLTRGQLSYDPEKLPE